QEHVADAQRHAIVIRKNNFDPLHVAHHRGSMPISVDAPLSHGSGSITNYLFYIKLILYSVPVQGVLYIDDLDQASVLMKPARIDVLRRMADNTTCSEIG